MRLLTATAAALLLLAPSAAADYVETERRLKAVGVDEALRTRIHASIDRCVAFLVEGQGARGSWVPRNTGMRPWRSGVTALCALSLRHAGTRETCEPVDRAVRFLMGPSGRGRKAVLGGVYTGGITTMLLMADRSHAEVAHVVASRIASCQRRGSGWWGYCLTDEQTAQTTTQVDRSNLSTSQFAVLGLWAGARAGTPTPPIVWHRLLESMIRTQLPTGSWSYFPTRGGAARGSQTGTFMGVANLVLAESGLGPVLRADRDLRGRASAARVQATRALHEEGRSFLESIDPVAVPSRSPEYYTLYALEKACIFLGLEEVDGLAWYRSGAETLLQVQNKDGGWGNSRRYRTRTRDMRSDYVSTAFALLFLLRSSEVYRPVTPSPVDGAKPVVTEGTGE